MKTNLLTLALLILQSAGMQSQILADSETHGIVGQCTSCNVSNPGNASDNNTESFSTLNLPSGPMSTYMYQGLRFSVKGNPGETVGIVLEDCGAPDPGNGFGAPPQKFPGVSFTTYLNGVSNNDLFNASQINMQLIPGSNTRYVFEFPVSAAYDEIRVRMNAGPAGTPASATKVYYAYHTSSTPFPLTLIDFNAADANGAVSLSWITDIETNNDFFTIERSSDGYSYTEVAQIDSKGNQGGKTHYQYDDASASSGINYYRLRQTDIGGHVTYFDAISVEHSMDKAAFKMICAPDAGFINLEYTAQPGDDTRFLIIDLAGNTMGEHALSCTSTSCRVSCESMQPGIYYGYFVVNNKVTGGQKLLLQK